MTGKLGLMMRSKKGSVLIMVMLVMLLLSAVIVFSLTSAKDDTHSSFRQLFLLQARYMTEGATERAKGDVLCQIAATNFLGGNFNTVGSLYANIHDRFNVAAKRIPSNLAAADIDWTDTSIIARSRWDFSADDTLDIPGVNDWGIGDDGDGAEPLGIVRTYITRSIIDEAGDANNNTVGSYETTLTSWAQVGPDALPATVLTSKSFSHGLVFPRLFDFLYLGNALSDCSMCHLKIMGDIGQVNAADPFEMHIGFNSSRFNRLTLYGTIYTNGNFIRAAQGEAQGPNRQERMMYAPGQDNDYSKPEGGVKPQMLIFSKNAGELVTQFNSESNPYPNPFRAVTTMATPLPTTWPSVKNNLLEWFEPRAVTSAAANSAKIEVNVRDNNVGYVLRNGTNSRSGALPWLRPVRITRPNVDPANNFAATPQTLFQPYLIRNTTALWRFDGANASNIILNDLYNNGMNPFRYYPFLLPGGTVGGVPHASLITTTNTTRVPYGYQDIWTETYAANYTQVTARTAGGDGRPDLDLNEDGLVNEADDALRIYAFSIERARNRYQIGNSSRENLDSSSRLNIDRGLHPVDDFDYDTIPNGFDPDFDGDGMIESGRAASVESELGYYVTTIDAVTNNWIVWVDSLGREAGDAGYDAATRRPQWKLGMQKVRFASWTVPYNPLPTVYWVRAGALDFVRARDNNVDRPGSGTNRTNWDLAQNQSNLHATNAEVVNTVQTAAPSGQHFTNMNVVVWAPTTATDGRNSPLLHEVWVNGGASKCYPVILTERTDGNRRWFATANDGLFSYRRANQDVMTLGRISILYTIIDTSPVNLVSRNFGWAAEVAGVASATSSHTAMENLILSEVRAETTGVFPNATLEGDGDPVLATNPGLRSLIIKGTNSNPVRIAGQIVVRGDVVILGAISGIGTIVAHRNFFIPNDLYYTNPPNYFDFSSTAGDRLGLIAAGNVMVGNILHNTTGRSDMMEFVWGNMVDINSAEITGATSWNYGRDSAAKPSNNHQINPVYLYDGSNAGYWSSGDWVIENEGNCVDERFNAQGMRLGGGLQKTAPKFNDARRHVNFGGNSNPSTTLDSGSYFKNYWISTPGLLPEGASRVSAMPTTVYGTYTGAWFSPEDFKTFTVWPRNSTSNWVNGHALTRTEASNRWIRIVEGVLYADYGVIGGNLASVGPNFLEFRGAVIGRDIQILSAVSNNSGDNGTLRPPTDFFGQYRVGGLYYDHRLRGTINPLGFPFTEKFIGGEMAHNSIPPLVNGQRDSWRPFRLREEFKYLVQE